MEETRDTAIDVIEPVKVLILCGPRRPGVLRGAGDLLRLAMAPRQSTGEKGPDPATVKMATVEQWPQENLNDYQVVVLADVPSVSPAQGRVLEQFVYDGGSLLIVPGNLTCVDSYNAVLYRNGTGILPAKLEPATELKPTTLLNIDRGHPVFQFLKGRSDPVPPVWVRRCLPATLRPDARVLADYACNLPFLIESQPLCGRVLLMTSSADLDWNTLPLTNFYLPLMQSAVRYLAAGLPPGRNLSAGQPIRARVPDLIAEPPPTMTLPNGAIAHDGLTYSGLDLSYADTDSPGRYVLRGRTTRGSWLLDYIIRPSPEESDPTPLSKDQWRELQKQLDFDLVDSDDDSLAAVVGSARRGLELWGGLLAAVVLLALAELLVSRLGTREIE